MMFGDAALRLAGLAGVIFGWRPEEFWQATPAELAALLQAAAPADTPPAADVLHALKERFPDG
jgi:uncharacterized phage protein (TIGR02216 family)